MDYKLFAISFAAIFLAELGDKTQLATMGFAAQNPAAKWTVFFASALALIASSFLGVLLGGKAAQYISPEKIKIISAILFIIIGLLLIFDVFYDFKARKYEAVMSFIVNEKVIPCRECPNFQAALKESDIKEIKEFINEAQLSEENSKKSKGPHNRCAQCNALKLKELIANINKHS